MQAYSLMVSFPGWPGNETIVALTIYRRCEVISDKCLQSMKHCDVLIGE